MFEIININGAAFITYIALNQLARAETLSLTPCMALAIFLSKKGANF